MFLITVVATVIHSVTDKELRPTKAITASELFYTTVWNIKNTYWITLNLCETSPNFVRY